MEGAHDSLWIAKRINENITVLHIFKWLFCGMFHVTVGQGLAPADISKIIKVTMIFWR